MTSLLLPLVVVAALHAPTELRALVDGLARSAPSLDDVTVERHASAALRAGLPDAPAGRLLALGWRESRYTEPARPQCGVVQVAMRTAPRCAALLRAGLVAEYRAGAERLAEWAGLCRRMRRRDVERCALQGYAEGVASARSGRVDRALWVLQRERRIAGALYSVRRSYYAPISWTQRT